MTITPYNEKLIKDDELETEQNDDKKSGEEQEQVKDQKKEYGNKFRYKVVGIEYDGRTKVQLRKYVVHHFL